MVSSPFLLPLALLLSFTLLFVFPLNQSHFSFFGDLQDIALFHRATIRTSHLVVVGSGSGSGRGGGVSSVSRLGITSNPKPKIAFLFLTNSDLFFAPLWERFFRGHGLRYNIYIHADPSVELNQPGGVFDGRFIPARRTERASPTLITAARRLLAHAVIDDPLNLYFALVSQRCIPIHSFDFMYNFLFKNSVTSLRSFSSKSTYKSYIEILSDEPNLYERYIARGATAMLPEVPFERFRVGSQFFILTRNHAVLVVKERKLWRKFKLPCLGEEPCYPEEHYFPTLLSMEDPQGCSHYTLTRVNWTGCWDGHPHLYSPEEVSPALIQTLRQSNSSYSFFFARKFSPEALTPLMEIADDVIFRD
ncbi:Glycosyltransferase BC10, partial [Cucurbita argyrosperma subsp. sororia]